MRFVLSVLGCEVFSIELCLRRDAESEVEAGPPFGFSGSNGSHVERVEPWSPDPQVNGKGASCG